MAEASGKCILDTARRLWNNSAFRRLRSLFRQPSAANNSPEIGGQHPLQQQAHSVPQHLASDENGVTQFFIENCDPGTLSDGETVGIQWRNSSSNCFYFNIILHRALNCGVTTAQ